MHVYSTPREAFLDQIRGIAILYVLAVHTFDFWFPGGGCGVGIFYGLSGYLTAARVLQVERFDWTEALKFWARRIFRLYPAFIVVMLMIFVILWRFLPDRVDLFLAAIPGLMFFRRPIDWEPLGIGVGILWSLRVEAFYYLILPLAIIWGGMQRGLLALCAVMMASSLVSILIGNDDPLGGGIWHWGGGLALGSLAAHLERHNLAALGRVLKSRHFIWLLYGVLGLLLFLPQISSSVWWMEVMLAAAVTSLLILVHLSQPTIWIAPGLPWIGRLAYCLYLTHGIVIDYMRPVLGLTKIEKIVLFIPITLGLSIVLNRLVELPCIELGKRAIMRLTSNRMVSDR